MGRKQKSYKELRNYGKNFEFVVPSDAEWTLDQLDQGKLKRIKRFLIETDRKLGGILPRTVEISDDNNPVNIGMQSDLIGMDISSLDYLGERKLSVVMAHESAHLTYKDTAIIDTFSKMQGCLCGIKDIQDVYEENPASCCGLILDRFGSLETFKYEMTKALLRTNEIRRFFSGIGIEPDTDRVKLANELIAGKEKQNQLDRFCDMFPNDDYNSVYTDPTYRFCKNFAGETIAHRERMAALDFHDFVDYESFLPQTPAERNMLAKGVAQVYRDIVLPTLSVFKELAIVERIIHHAMEHRADYEALLRFGPEAALDITRFYQKEYHDELNRLPEKRREELRLAKLDLHPHPDDRIKFIESHSITNQHVCYAQSRHKHEVKRGPRKAVLHRCSFHPL
ncbi:MAG: hypothetical protein PHY92_05540 [Alphaproteobacteria bacterium]|nr:hypothetical protein [Alphaproteobacteria bacterium]